MADNPVFLAGQRVPAGKLNKFGTEATLYTPSLEAATSNPTLGTSPIQEGMWFRNGELAHVYFYIQFGTGSPTAGTGSYFVTLPTDAPVLDLGLDRFATGEAIMVDSSGGPEAKLATPYWKSGDSTAQMRIGIGETITDVSASAPWTWAANDYVHGHLVYPADFT